MKNIWKRIKLRLSGHVYEYPRPAVAATMVVINEEDETTLLARRIKTANAYPGENSIPGGFVDEGTETVTEAAIRELREEVGLEVSVDDMILVKESSTPGTDPRCHVVNLLFYTRINSATAKTLEPNDDIEEISWTSLVDAVRKKHQLAFNHTDLLANAVEKYYNDKQSMDSFY